jgi:hypothetical protein
MPLSLNVTHSKKVGLPNYGSLGACCSVGIELDGSLLKDDPEKFRHEVRDAFAACRVAVEQELTRDHVDQTASVKQDDGGNGQSNGVRSERPATVSQVRAIHAIANRHKVNLTELLQNEFQVDRPDDLPIVEASSLIDLLKAATLAAGGGR